MVVWAPKVGRGVGPQEHKKSMNRHRMCNNLTRSDGGLLGPPECKDVSGKTGRTTSRAASWSLELRGCLRRNGLDHLSRGISGLRIARMSQAKRAGPPQARASRSPELGGRLRRNRPDHLSRGISELRFRRMSQAKRPIPDNSETRVVRMSQAKRPIPDNTETRVVRMSQAKRPGPPDFVEDVSASYSLGPS